MACADDAELFAAGKRAWPGLDLPVETFARHLSTRGTAGGRIPLLYAPDFYLTCACAERIRGALEAFDRAHLAELAITLASLRPAPALVDEVRQVLREKLFVGRPGAEPKITVYDGRGALSTWLRVIAIRTAFDILRQNTAAPGPSRDAEAPATADAEGSYLKQRYRRQFNEAIRTSIASMPPDQRELLRLHFVEGLTLDELAARSGVHRATIARKLAAARTEVRRGARRLLLAELGVTEAELDSLSGLMRSQLELSLSGLQPRD
jgi:RNA polymerase sigma-70 factor (ECF subfamily)